MGRLIILSGPSCVGKSSLHKALLRLYPEFAARLQKLVLYASRPPRPGNARGSTTTSAAAMRLSACEISRGSPS